MRYRRGLLKEEGPTSVKDRIQRILADHTQRNKLSKDQCIWLLLLLGVC